MEDLFVVWSETDDHSMFGYQREIDPFINLCSDHLVWCVHYICKKSGTIACFVKGYCRLAILSLFVFSLCICPSNGRIFQAIIDLFGDEKIS
jgi:hypothetical protein